MAQDVVGKTPLREELEKQSARRAREGVRKVANLIVAALIEHGWLTQFSGYQDDTIYARFVIGTREYRVSVESCERSE